VRLFRLMLVRHVPCFWLILPDHVAWFSSEIWQHCSSFYKGTVNVSIFSAYKGWAVLSIDMHISVTCWF